MTLPDGDGSAPSASGARMLVARATLGWVVAALALAFLGFSLYQHRAAVAQAFAATPPWAVVVAAIGVLVMVASHLPLWMRLLAGSGVNVAYRRAAPVVFVGQLGKYVPGGVWSVVAQASLARELGIPTRRTIGTSLSLIVVQLAGAGVIAGLVTGLGYGPDIAPEWTGWGLFVGSCAVLTRPVLGRLNGLLAGTKPELSRRGAWEIVAITLFTWVVVGATAIPLLTAGEPTTGGAAAGLAAAVSLAFIAGVVMVFAPAGLGVREAVLLSTAGPLVGAGRALAAAMVLRVLSAVADVSAAAISKLIDKRDVPMTSAAAAAAAADPVSEAPEPS